MYNSVLGPGVTTPLTGRDQAEAISFRDAVRFLRKALPTILACMLALAGLGVAYCSVVKPRFSANAQILIEPARTPSLMQDNARAASVTLETETGRIESQIQIIKSDQITRDVIGRLGLMADAEFKLPVKKAGFAIPLLGVFRDEPPQTPEDLVSARTSYAIDTFASKLTVRRIGQSFVIEVQFVSDDADKASRITNAILDAYIEADVSAKADSARRGSAWLTERLDELRDQVATSRGALERFKASSDVQSASDRSVKFFQLESVAQTQSRLYDAFLQRSLETVQNITYPVPDAHVIASATKPQTKSFPKTGLVVAFTGLIGAALGVGLAMIRSGTDRRIRSPKTAAAATQCAVLGLIAAMPKGRTNAHILGGGRSSSIGAARPRGLGLGLQADKDFRALKIAFNTAQSARPKKRIGVTSPGDAEGKTTVAASLAAMLAYSDTRVLLVDLCRNEGAISSFVAPQVRPDAAELLRDPQTLPQAIVPHPSVENLFVLPAGRAAWPVSPAELFASPRHRLVMDALGSSFDMVVFDMPATETSPEALALAPLLDGVIVVSAFRATTLDALEDCVERLRGSRAEILGLVVNKIPTREMNA